MTNTWIGGTTGNWFVASNWSEGSVPQTRSWDMPQIGGNATVSYDKADSTFLSNGLSVASGATLNITAVSASAQVLNVNGLQVAAGATVNIQTPSAIALGSSNTTINGTLVISNNDAVSFGGNGSTVAGNGTLVLDHSALAATLQFDRLNMVVKNGSKYVVNSNLAGGSITFGDVTTGGNNQIVLPDYNTTISAPIYNFNSQSIITVANGNTAPISAAFSRNTDGSYTLSANFDAYGNGVKLTNIHFAPGVTPTEAAIHRNADGSWSVVAANSVRATNDGTVSGPTTLSDPCFLAGTRLLTDRGYVPVEEIGQGDRLMVETGDGLAPREVVWTGRQSRVVQPGRSDDDAGYPVRIHADAFREGVPERDLLVTAEHCFLFEGGFVPVRMLVNGRSIAYDRSFTQYDYFHVETASHDVIFAEGAATESYLDTSDRGMFVSGDRVVALPKRGKVWGQDSAAPLQVSRDAVEPLFHALDERATQLGYPVVATSDVTFDPDLCLLTESGVELRFMREQNGQKLFSVPPGCDMVQIVSRASRPADAIGPFLDDRRTLGVLIEDVRLWNADIQRNIALDGLDAAGWYPAVGTMRWTNGHAILPLARTMPDSFAVLSLRIVAAGPYLIDTQDELLKRPA